MYLKIQNKRFASFKYVKKFKMKKKPVLDIWKKSKSKNH
jgi:hypothetical protein